MISCPTQIHSTSLTSHHLWLPVCFDGCTWTLYPCHLTRRPSLSYSVLRISIDYHNWKRSKIYCISVCLSVCLSVCHSLILFSYCRCEQTLISTVEVHNCIRLYQTSEEHNAEQLKTYCLQIISSHWVSQGGGGDDGSVLLAKLCSLM